MRKALASLAFAAASLTATPALADDFVFNVPVRIENADMIEAAQVWCRVFFSADSAVGEIFADNRAPVPIAGGAFNGTVAVTVTPPAAARRADASSWLCELNLMLVTADSRLWLGTLPEVARPTRYTLASGRMVTANLSENAALPRP